MLVRLRPLLLVVAAAAAALALSACGDKQSVPTVAATEGPYINVGSLWYQVQISRQLNPASVEDRGYLIGLSPSERRLKPNETWFAVFMLVFNTSSKTPHQAADQFEIVDTLGNRYGPYNLGLDNVFAYRARNVAQNSPIPLPDSAAGQGPIQGAMLLFKLPYSTLDNRPLVLHVTSPKDSRNVGKIVLDV
jgi:hypothetical protein